MASLRAVGQTLCKQIIAAVYPDGADKPSVADHLIRVVHGWPLLSEMAKDMEAGNAQVSVCPRPGASSTTPLPDWQTLEIQPATLTAGVEGQTLTLGGA